MGIRFNWSARHGPVAAAIAGAGNTAGLTAVADAVIESGVVDISPWWALAVGAAGATTSAITAAAKNLAGRAVCYRAACWFGASTWSTEALANGGIDFNRAMLLTVGAIIAGGTANVWSRQERREQAIAEANQLRQVLIDRVNNHPLSLAKRDWEDRLKRIARIENAEVINVEPWPTGAGHTIEVELPDNGTTWQDVKAHEDGLSASLKAEQGCGVEVLPGVNYGVCLIERPTRNVLKETVDPDEDFTRRSINGPLKFGRVRNGEWLTAVLREYGVLAIGQKRSGKTTLINQVACELLLTDDALPIIIDFNGGSLAMPFLLAWRTLRAKLGPDLAPPIPVVARTPEQALLVTEWLLDVAKDRKTAYAALKYEKGVTLLPLSHTLPQFALLMDESAEVLGVMTKDPVVQQVRANIAALQRMAGDSGVNTIVSALSAKNSMIGSQDIKANSAVRIGMRVSDPEELGYLFGNYRLDPSAAPYQGSGFGMMGPGEVIRVFKGPNVGPAYITRVIEASADGRRPWPDERSLSIPSRVLTLQDGTEELEFHIGPHNFTDFWQQREQTEWLADLDASLGLSMQPAMSAASTRVAADIPKPRPKETNVDPISQMQRDVSAAQAAAEEMMRVAREADQRRASGNGGGDDDVKAQFEAIISPYRAHGDVLDGPTFDPRPDQPQPEQPVERKQARPSAKDRALQLVKEAGWSGTGASAIRKQMVAEQYTTTRQTISDWLGEWQAEGIVAQPGGKGGPYVHRDHLDSSGS
jgi:hypothetical protein